MAVKFLAALFGFAGLMHFVRPDAFVTIVPLWLPRPHLIVAVSGVAELLGAAGLLPRRTRRAAGIGLIALLVAVFPANIKMLADAIAAGAAPLWQAALWIRLPIQPLLIWMVWRSAVSPREASDSK